MKVVSLGAKNGNRMRFTAQGADAQRALHEIGQRIGQGLGEMVSVPVTPPPEAARQKRSWLSRLFN